MMHNGKMAALLAGQGVFREFTLSPLFLDQFEDTCREIDRVAVDRLGFWLARNLLTRTGCRSLRNTSLELTQLAVDGLSVASQGAEIVRERTAVLEKFAKGSGSMIALAAPTPIAEHLLRRFERRRRITDRIPAVGLAA